MGMRLKNFELPKSIIFDEDSYEPTYGRIIAEPFEKGYGITIGNSLRRVLLSSIEGTASEVSGSCGSGDAGWAVSGGVGRAVVCGLLAVGFAP